jgi:transposase
LILFVDIFRKVDTMSAMATDSRGRRVRRQFTEDFKESAVRLVLDEGKSVGAVARELDLTTSALGLWVKQARAERSQGRTGLTKAERDELSALRKENRILREERDILKKRRPSSRSRIGKVPIHRRGEGHACRRDVVSMPAGHTQRVLRLAAATRIDARATRPPIEGADPHVVHTRARVLRESART